MGKKTNAFSEEEMRAIGTRLREVIEESGLRQQDVAMRAGIGMRTLGWYLAGRDMPASTLMRIAMAVGMEPGDLMSQLTIAFRRASTSAGDADTGKQGKPAPAPAESNRAVREAKLRQMDESKKITKRK